METAKITQYARALFDAHGDKAELEAGNRARECRDAGKDEEAETWHAVRLVIRQIRGAHQG